MTKIKIILSLYVSVSITIPNFIHIHQAQYKQPQLLYYIFPPCTKWMGHKITELTEQKCKILLYQLTACEMYWLPYGYYSHQIVCVYITYTWSTLNVNADAVTEISHQSSHISQPVTGNALMKCFLILKRSCWAPWERDPHCGSILRSRHAWMLWTANL